MDLVIFGAQGIALGAYEALSHLYPKRKISCFLVTKKDSNAESLLGIPVKELASFTDSLSQQEKDQTEVLIATPENVMEEIETSLEQRGLFYHVRLTSDRCAELMRYRYILTEEYKPLSVLPVGYHKADLHMYMAKSYKDKPLIHNYNLPEWIIPIQAGAALCGERVAALLDCNGENISKKNGNYSELTVLYWIWKNCLYLPCVRLKGYYGLVHYRRILDFSADDLLRLMNNEVDVVLPYPMPYEPNIEVHHKRYLKDKDWDAVIMAVQELYPEYMEDFRRILKQRYLYNYNIMLAKAKIMKDYCEWLFTILEKVEELSIPKGYERQDRYIGYIGETMTTLYFMANRTKLNIVHTGYKFLV